MGPKCGFCDSRSFSLAEMTPSLSREKWFAAHCTKCGAVATLLDHPIDALRKDLAELRTSVKKDVEELQRPVRKDIQELQNSVKQLQALVRALRR